MRFKSLNCTICNRVFKNRERYRYHSYTAHKTERPFKCKLCEKSYKLSFQLTKHVKDSHMEKEFKCDLCPLTFPRICTLKIHQRRHLKAYTDYCEYCSKGFYNKSEVAQHIEINHDVKEKYKCEVCSKLFSADKLFQLHKRIHAEGYVAKYFECSFCDKKYDKKSLLERHMRVHTGETQQHVCHFCGKTLTSKTSLRDHLLMHFGEKPFECDLCEKRFSKKMVLKVHRRTHTGEKPFKCQFCEKTFTQQSPLTLHIRGHTGERPYKCQLCEEGFVSKHLLEAHKTKAHMILKVDIPENVS